MRALFLLLMVAGCSNASDGPHIDFQSQMYMLQPGEEKYYCYTTTLPADRDVVVTKLTPTYGAGTHHILFSQTLTPEPDGFSECPVLSRTTWVPLYAGGLNSGPLVLPDHTGFKPLDRGQQLVMQLHLQNATPNPITAQTAMRIDYADATPDYQPAGIFGFDDRNLTIPPNTSDALNQMNCTMGRDLNVFAVMGHMHKHGVHLDLSRGANAGDQMLYQEDWNFDLQPVTPMVFNVHQGDNMFLRCTHENDANTPLAYGESSDTEMCALVMYAAPASAVDGCVKM
jgi:hypothetical protein